MAQPTQNTALLQDSTGQEVKEKVVESEGGEVEDARITVGDGSSSTPFVAVTNSQVEKTSTDAQPNAPLSRPSLVPLGSGHAQSSSSTPVAPQAKRFSAVNINKKFLEKNTASGSTAASSSSSASKAGSPAARPSTQPNSSHSRLVTAKLTGNPAVSSSAAGWSRPSSVAPSPATVGGSPGSTSPLPTPAVPTLSTSVPQLPHAGKVIQPQPRNAVSQLVSLQKETASAKPVWGNVKPPVSVPIRAEIQANDFPTAAEVANVASAPRKSAKTEESKAEDAKALTESTSKQLRSEEADTFRGIHLDPNTHHWDEAEDDDNFLDEPIEFGDGRQYKVDTSDSLQLADSSTVDSDLKTSASGPVKKEDRFGEDFDRSWPRSKESSAPAPRELPPPAVHSASPNISPVISHAAYSPQDSSRVLFNERSNRLEPYSQTHRSGPGPFIGKRSSFHEANGVEPPRGARDGPQNPHNIQVLQKSSDKEFSRARRFSASNGGIPPSTSNGFAGGHRETRRDVPLSPRLTRDQPPHAMDGAFNDRGRRTSMGPPPLPPHALQKDNGRQLPPHLSQVSPNHLPRRLPSRDSRLPLPEPPLSASSTSGRFPQHSPTVSHASLSLISPVAGPHATLPLTAPELDEARKDVMQTAAARAKARRQQEEEEREAQKERARRKAAEIEEKCKAIEAEKQKLKNAEDMAKATKEKAAIDLIEEAVQSAQVTKELEDGKPDPVKPFVKRPPDIKTTGASAADHPLTPGAIPPLSANAIPQSRADSWRARANPLPPHTLKQIQPRPPTSATFVAPGPSAAEQIESIADGSKDELEVVDFSDMGKFVGVAETVEAPAEEFSSPKPAAIVARPTRASASDYFDDPMTITESAMTAAKKAEFGAWRRRVSQDVPEVIPTPTKQDKVEDTEHGKKVESTPAYDQPSNIKDKLDTSFSTENSTTKEPLGHLDGSQGQSQTVHVPSLISSQRTPRSQTFYKEATMSALDDAMSRIKGALVGMHAQDVPPKDVAQTTTQEAQPTRTAPSQPPSRFVRDRWIPPALRPQHYDDSDEPREVFLVTIVEPPASPDTSISVRLPSVSQAADVISKKQLHAFTRPPFPPRMDILSFDPPVPEMSRKTLSLNDVLFRTSPASFKGKYKYRVVLPKYRGPKAHIPVGGFGRPTIADGASSWRKPLLSQNTIQESPLENGLNTMSRSPPPEITPPEATIASIPKASETPPAKSDGINLTRSRSQPKMPEGSAVAFRRDSRIDVFEVDAKPRVNFIVGSELEDPKPAVVVTTGASRAVSSSPITIKSDLKPDSTKLGIDGVVSSTQPEELSFASTKDESRSSDDSTERILITPPSHHSSSPWARSSLNASVKESPARAPDPEHLKAVWSQPSNKNEMRPVNSLEGIADDLTALPFTLHDVKSEDGETPPPLLPTAPPRMSLHDVTRAFQQVPTSSSTPAQAAPRDRANISPPSTNAPVARPAPIGYTYAPPSNMRPAYGPYPSPMMSHSPAPVMYGHPMAGSPVPSRMSVNGHAPPYGQSMWVPMPGPAPQAHGMRAVPSPYPTQMMHYPSPGYAPQHPHAMMPPTPQSQNGGRGRGVPLMSPVMTHTHVHPYSGSPVVMHAPTHGYMPMPAGRGQPRTDNGHMTSPQHQHPSQNHQPPMHTGFNPSPASPFVRPW